MKFDATALKSIRSYLDDPSDPKALYGLSSLYWSSVIDTICEIIHAEGDTDEFLSTEKYYINAGIIEKILENSEDIQSRLDSETLTYSHLTVQVTTEWLKETFQKINAGDKKELLENDIKTLEIQQTKIDNEIANFQDLRKDLLMKVFLKTADKNITARIDNLTTIDHLTLQDMQTKKEIAKGVFFSVENRREFVARTNHLQKENVKKDELFSKVTSSDEKTALRNYSSQISTLFEKSISTTDTIIKKEEEIDTIEKDQSSLSLLEIENRVRAELEYLRDMVKLSAKRLRMESCPILRPNHSFFTLKELCSCFDRIMEFDPQIFHNDRVSIFGKPSALLVPGNGSGLYDWKNNRFIIPMVPPGGNFMASIATAIIEYRLDVDEDKKLLTSFQKLPELKNVRSMVALRASLTKEYIKWMTSEYQGFKVLDKETRIWFEHEIAPSKIDLFCPPQYQQFELTSRQHQKLLETIEKKLADGVGQQSQDDLWAASILKYQQGKFNTSLEYINKLLTSYPDHIFGYYNLGIIAMKIPQKQTAIKGFSEFMKKKPQSWWAAVARDHVRRLQV